MALAAGQLPHWNPYLFSGTPHVADVQTLVFYPPAMLLRWLRPDAFLSWQAVVHMWIGGAGAMFLGRVVGLSWWGSAAAAFAVALGGTNASRLYNGHLLVINGVAWLPWALALSIQAVRRGRLAPSPALVFVMVLQFLSGTGRAASTLAPSSPCTLYSVAWPDKEGIAGSRWRPLAQLVLLGLVTLGLTAFQMLPTIGLALEAARSKGIPYEEAIAGAWTAADLVTFLYPFSGVEGQPAVRFIADRIAYVGWLLTLVSPFAFLDARRRRLVVFCSLLIAFAVAFAMEGLQLYRLHYFAFPGLRAPSRLLFGATVGLAVLGGLGLDGLVERARQRQWKPLLVPGLIALAAASAATNVASANWNVPEVPPVHGWPWIPFLAVVGLIAVVHAAWTGAAQRAMIVGLIVCGLDLTVYARGGAHPVSVESEAVLRSWLGSSGPGRAVSLCESRLDAGGLLLAGSPSITGPVGVALGDYIEWLDLLDTGGRPSDTIGDTGIRRDLLNSVNVSTIVSCKPIEEPSLELVSHVDQVYTYRNTTAWPRATWTCEVEEMERSAIVSRLARGRYDRNRSPQSLVAVRWVEGIPVERRTELGTALPTR